MTDLQRLSVESALLRMLQAYNALDQSQATSGDTIRQIAVSTRKEIEAAL